LSSAIERALLQHADDDRSSYALANPAFVVAWASSCLDAIARRVAVVSREDVAASDADEWLRGANAQKRRRCVS
jgi:hypothetical protein